MTSGWQEALHFRRYGWELVYKSAILLKKTCEGALPLNDSPNECRTGSEGFEQHNRTLDRNENGEQGTHGEQPGRLSHPLKGAFHSSRHE